MEEFGEDGERASARPVGEDHCPRCDAPVADTVQQCPDCGLEL